MPSALKRCWPNLAGGAVEGAQGPRLLTGTGAQQTHLLLVCTGERGLCGAFNTSIVRLARERANALIAQGKTVKIICVGKKGYDQLRRTFEKQIIDLVDLRAVRTLGYGNAQPIAKKGARFVRGRRIRRLHAFFCAVQIGDGASSDRPATDSPGIRKSDEDAPAYEYEPEEGEILAQLLPSAVAVRIYRALLEKHGLFLRLADERDGQCDAATPAT